MYAMVDPPRFAGVAQSAILFEGRKTFCFGDGSDRFLGEAAMVSRLAVRSGLAPTLVIESFKCRVGKL